MPPSDRPWFPTTPGQCTLVYVLNAVLLCNLTVIVVMLTGGLPPMGQSPPRAQVPWVSDERVLSERFPPDEADEPVETIEADEIERPAPHRPSPQAKPIREPTPKQVVGINAPTPVDAPERTAPVEQASPDEDDPPVTFFGVGLE